LFLHNFWIKFCQIFKIKIGPKVFRLKRKLIKSTPAQSRTSGLAPWTGRSPGCPPGPGRWWRGWAEERPLQDMAFIVNVDQGCHFKGAFCENGFMDYVHDFKFRAWELRTWMALHTCDFDKLNQPFKPDCWSQNHLITRFELPTKVWLFLPRYKSSYQGINLPTKV
jgi:hypothetical protein